MTRTHLKRKSIKTNEVSLEIQYETTPSFLRAGGGNEILSRKENGAEGANGRTVISRFSRDFSYSLVAPSCL